MSRRQSFAVQIEDQRRASTALGRAGRLRRQSTHAERLSLAQAVGAQTDEVTSPFESAFAPTEMRQLALVAHNHMKPAMKEFIQTYSEILKKFRITGTQTTMAMCKSLWKEDPSVEYGKTCTSGPLGGDAQIAALMCMEDLGGIIFFVDPLSSHPHQADIDSLLRLANCGNIVVCPNPASAISMMYTLRAVLLEGDSARGLVPSFFETMESPAVTRYKHQQAVALANMIKVKGTPPSAPVTQSAEPDDEKKKKVMEVGGGESERPASFNFKDDMKEAPSALDQGVRRKTTKAPRALSGRAIDRALMGESMVFGADLQAMLLSELNDKDTDYSKEDEEEEEDDDAAAVAPTSATVPIVDHDHVVMKRINTLDYSGHLLNPAMDLSAHPRYHTMDYSTHSNLRSVEEFGDEDDDSLEGEEDVEVSAPIATTTANTNTNTLARFKSSSSMSKGKGKGRMGVKNLCQKVVRRMTISSGQKQERPFIVTAAATTPTPGESVLEREKFDLESEMIMLALKQQMELIEMLKNRH